MSNNVCRSSTELRVRGSQLQERFDQIKSALFSQVHCEPVNVNMLPPKNAALKTGNITQECKLHVDKEGALIRSIEKGVHMVKNMKEGMEIKICSRARSV